MTLKKEYNHRGVAEDAEDAEDAEEREREKDHINI